MAEDKQTFLNRFKGVRKQGQGFEQYQCNCPHHNDRKASLSIRFLPDADKILLDCKAGCETEDVLADVGLTMADIMPNREPKKLQPWQKDLVAEYRYIDADGRYQFSKLRYEGPEIDGKKIQYARIINGKYQAGKGDAAPVLYNLPALQKANKDGRRVYIVEGEKDVETLRQYSMIAVTAGGVSDWKTSYADYFIGASEVVILPDRDEPGQKLAERISKDLRSVVYCHKVATPSGLIHGDVTDFLTKEDGTVEDLLETIEKAEPILASWVIPGKRATINVDLLAAEILKRTDLFIARNPGTKSDIVFWYGNGKYSQMAETEIAGQVRRWLPVGRATPDTISKVARMIIYSSEVKPYDDINRDEQKINLRDGLLDIKTGKFGPHDPQLISSLQLDCNYKPEATALKWDAFIKELCMDPETETVDLEMYDVLQEWTGLILSTIYGYRVKKSLILFSPQGNSGKTVFLSVLAGILGKDAVSNVDFKSLGSSRWATGRAFSKRCLLVGDEGGERIESSAIFKQLTGGDTVSAEFKGLQGFDYTFRGVIVAACNVLPYFDDDKGNHVVDRLHLVHCRHTVPTESRDPLLVDKLLQERDGIFQWAWAGLRRFLDNGMRFSHCQSSEDLTSEYRARYDTMYAFIRDELELTGNRLDTMKKTDLEYQYSRYCQEQELTPLSKKNIAVRLASLGISKVVRHGYTVYVGVREKDFAEMDPDIVPEF